MFVNAAKSKIQEMQEKVAFCLPPNRSGATSTTSTIESCIVFMSLLYRCRRRSEQLVKVTGSPDGHVCECVLI
jgi:hypothetical protein